MEQPMLEIKADTKASSTTAKVTPNLLPCRINHAGSVEPAQTFWNPGPDKDGLNTAYFRGRKLHGKTVKVPEGYRGVVAEKREPSPSSKEDEKGARSLVPADAVVIDLDDVGSQQGGDAGALGSLQVRAEFDDMVVWCHGATADASADPYIRGIEEWMSVAEQIHSYSAEK